MTVTTFVPIPASPEQLAALSRDLVKAGERLEKRGGPEWFAVARAAALVDGLRLGLVSLPGGNHGAHL